MRAWLHEKGLELEERDFFRDRFSEDELRQLLQGERLSEVFSWSSPSFKALGVAAAEQIAEHFGSLDALARADQAALRSLDRLVEKKRLMPRRFGKSRTYARQNILDLIADGTSEGE